MKKNSGITLIALVITIIVMLILVGVSVTVALNGGLFTRAKTAASGTEEEREKELALSNGDIVDQWVNGGSAASGNEQQDTTVYHNITWNLTNIKTEGLPTQVEDKGIISVTLVPEEGYYLPARITSVDGSTPGYTYQASSGQLIIGEAFYEWMSGCTSDITITAEASDQEICVFKLYKYEDASELDLDCYYGTTWEQYAQDHGYMGLIDVEGYMYCSLYLNVYGQMYSDSSFTTPVLKTDTISKNGVYYVSEEQTITVE